MSAPLRRAPRAPTAPAPAHRHRPARPAAPRHRRRTNSGMPAKSVATIGKAWLAASITTLGKPSRSPSPACLEGSTKRSASRSAAMTSACAFGPAQADARCKAQRLGLRLQAPSASRRRRYGSVANAGRPASVASAASRSSKPFFSTARPMVTKRTGSAASLPSRGGALRAARKAGEIEPVIDQRDLVRLRRQPRQARDGRRACRSRPRRRSRSSRASPNPASSRCPWHGPRTTSSGRAAAPHSGSPRPAYAGSAHADADAPPAARAPSRRPGRSGASGCASGRARDRAGRPPARAESRARHRPSTPRSTRPGSSCRYSGR